MSIVPAVDLMCPMQSSRDTNCPTSAYSDSEGSTTLKGASAMQRSAKPASSSRSIEAVPMPVGSSAETSAVLAGSTYEESARRPT